MGKDIQTYEYLIGKKFNRLTITNLVRFGYGKRRSLVVETICDCGTIKELVFYDVKTNHVQSCGCLIREMLSSLNKKHGQTNTRLYTIWCHMKERCYSKKDKRYNDYGGRGIIVCGEWVNDFVAFNKWAIENGYNESLTIERADVNGNYSPSNCLWIPLSEQNKNKRNTAYLTYKGVTDTVLNWAIKNGIKYATLYMRVRNGWREDLLFVAPTNNSNRKEILYN